MVTGSGSEATIIFTKANKEWPVVALINDSVDDGLAWQFSENGESMPADDGSIYYGGLFFADEEEPLTEFEKKVFDIAWIAISLGINAQNTALVEFAKVYSRELLELAFKSPEFKLALQKSWDEGNLIGYGAGQKSVEKNLPKWKRMRGGLAGNLNDKVFLVKRQYSYSLESSVSGDDEYIILKDLDKLPKE